ncbi:MAG: tandem-95 repeat protein [Desulfobacterales bacterium]|nr:tandem-95 repeat protein [Desulfobacterales bacterium]
MKKNILLTFFLFLFLVGSNAFANEVTIFGPNTYLRTSGSPDLYSDTFSAFPGQGTLIIKNGSYDGSKKIIDAISSATVSINGAPIFGVSDFNKNIYLLETTIDLQEDNTISIELASSPDSYLTVEITANPITGYPVADSQNVTMKEDTQANILLTGSDPNNNPITFHIDVNPVYGELIVTPPDLTYTPADDYYGQDSFTFYVNNGSWNSEAATVILEITPVNDPPIALNDTFISENIDGVFTTGNVLENDTDIDQDPLTIDNYTQPENGTITYNGDGTFTFSANEGFNGEDSFTYTVSDGNGGTDSAIVTLTLVVTYPPSITITEPDGTDDLADNTFIISWTDNDPDSNASITLYYDTDATNADGILIVEGIDEDPDNTDDQYIWTTSEIQEGNYYIYAVINDNQHEPVTSYSVAPVTIAHAWPITFDPVEGQLVLEGQELTFTVHAQDINNEPLT